MTDKTKNFLAKLKASGHWNEDYDYTEVDYVNSNTKIIVIHKKFGTRHLMNPSSMIQMGVKCVGQNLLNGYRDFNEARAFVKKLNLKNQKEWNKYVKGDDFPIDIPKSPNHVYSEEWVSWGDWLGTGRIADQVREFWSFAKARSHVHQLNLKSNKEWRDFARSDSRSPHIPSAPDRVYKNDGWLSWGDWLGTQTHFEGEFLDFANAREYARKLGLSSSSEWKEFYRSDRLPSNIPKSPSKVYQNEWISWGDWLGTGRIQYQKIKYWNFIDARAFVRGLSLKTKTEWENFCKSNQKPNELPRNPKSKYKREWLSWEDWLGTEIGFDGNYLGFDEARVFARSLGLKSYEEWKAYVKKGDKPSCIPKSPSTWYKDKGWMSWGDWLGTKVGYTRDYLPFNEARAFAQSLNLKSSKEWKAFSKTSKRPHRIPKHVERVYKNRGWVSWGDWLGTGVVAPMLRDYRSFVEARIFAQGLGLRNNKEWRTFCSSGEKPADIPVNPDTTYHEDWISWGDWLGYIGDGSHKWTKGYLIEFIQSLENELTNLESVELITIINSNNLAKKLKELGSLDDLVSSQAGTEQRKDVVQSILTELAGSEDEREGELELTDDDRSHEFTEELEVAEINDIKESTQEELIPFDPIAELKVYDNTMVTASLDDENIEFLVKNQLKKLWNRVLNGELDVEDLRLASGGQNFTLIKNRFFKEYDEIVDIEPPQDYIFPYKPNLMQKLVSYRLINEKRYGNWSGTGAGKTLSAILSGRLAGARNTVIICNNATVEGWVNSIHEYFDNNKVFTKKFLDFTSSSKYEKIDKYDVNLIQETNNYLILNYETFQLQDGEYIVSELLKKNRIDYIILDEVQNVKQRDDDSESTRRGVVNKLIIHSKEKNPELLVMAMSATPVINNLTEPKKLIELLTGESHDELETNQSIINGVEMYKALTRYGLRYRPNYGIAVNEELIESDGTELSEEILKVPKGAVVEFEKLLLPKKLDSIKNRLQKGTLVYTHYVTELSQTIGDFIKSLGFTVGYYTGEDKAGLRGFKDGEIDVLVGSAPIGTGVDGIQKVCNTLIPVILPWTSSEYDQLVGRVNRQGSKFEKVNIYIPQVVIPLGEDVWSWDKRRHNIIKFKASLADLAVDGRVPKNLLPPKSKLIEQAKQELSDWIVRLQSEDIITFEREELMIPLNPKQIEYKRNQLGDFSELNRSWNVSRSENTHKRLKEDPSEWFYYHSLYSEKRKTWSEIPYMEIAKKLKGRPDWVVADFGCGENLLAGEIPCKVHAFDHVAISDDVTACDMSQIPLEDSSVDAAVFSLSLMGANYKDYLKEAYRILKPYGNIFISEPSNRWEGKEDKLKEELESIGYKVFDTIRNTSRFIYMEGLKV